MKKNQLHLFVVLITMLVFSTLLVAGQDNGTDQATFSYSNPAKAGRIIATCYHGSITVKGYNGQEIRVVAKVREKLLKKSKKKSNMHIIQQRSTGLKIEEENNVVKISVRSMTNTVDLTITVPYSSSLTLKTYNRGDIRVENVSGELDINNYNGAISLNGVSGVAVTHTYNGPVKVTFKKILNKPMSFSSFNGDVDITFPANLKADVKLKTTMGSIYSDFDIKMTPVAAKKVSDERKKGGKFKISFDDAMVGKINGGGELINFKTYNGDIYIRKK